MNDEEIFEKIRNETGAKAVEKRLENVKGVKDENLCLLKVQIYQNKEGEFYSRIFAQDENDGLTCDVFVRSENEVRKVENHIYQDGDECGREGEWTYATFEEAVRGVSEKIKEIIKNRESVREKKREIEFFVVF